MNEPAECGEAADAARWTDEERLALYHVARLAGRLYAAEVDAPLYRTLTGPAARNLVAGTALEFIEPARAARGEATALEELAEEYCRLFVGPVAECPPYVSVQRGEALLGGRSRALLEAFYARHGLATMSWMEARLASPDHLAVLLAALARLLEAAPDRAANDEAARELLRDHLAPWAPAFACELARRANCSLYRTLAALTEGMVRAM